MFFWGMGLAWVVPVGAMLLGIGLAVNAVWRAVVPPFGVGRGATCGSCGYELTTVEGGRCSECGADLLKAGVLTRPSALRISGSLPAGLMGWTVLCVILAGIALSVVSAFQMNRAQSQSMSITSSSTFQPEQEWDEAAQGSVRSADYSIDIDADVTGQWGMPPESGVFTVTLDHASRETVLTMDAATGVWTMTDADDHSFANGNRFGVEDARLFYTTAGLDATDESLAYEASQLADLLDAALRDPANYQYVVLNATPDAPRGGLQQTSSTSGSSGPGPGFSLAQMIAPLVTLALATVLWIAGIVFILRRRASIVRGPRPAGA